MNHRGTLTEKSTTQAGGTDAPLPSGATLVEWAIASTIIILFTFAVIEIAGAIRGRQSVDNAIHRAARLAMIPGGTSSEVRSEIENLLNARGIRNMIVEISPILLANHTSGIHIRVRVPMRAASFIPRRLGGGEMLSRELTVRREGR